MPSAGADPSMAGGPIPPSDEVGVDHLAAVFGALPVGIELRGPDGAVLIANDIAAALARDPARTIETWTRPVAIGPETCTLTTTLDVTEQRRLTDELFSRAYLDELTGLPNRLLMDQSTCELIASIEPGTMFALAFIDVDNFKHINDYYSHAAGDSLLVKIAERISATLSPGDVLARIGGDEFVLLISPVTDTATLRAEIATLAERLKDPFFIDGYEVFASASIGVSVFPEHGTTYDVLRRNADCAMYRAKAGTKGTAVVFDETMSHAATARMGTEQRFRLALRDRRFCCAFQPKVDMHSHEVVGVEVLLRWRDEQGVIQAPGDFVGLATELGLIDEIAFLVLAEVMKDVAEIDDAFGAHTTISLNIAAKQADDLGFMMSFCDALDATGCASRFMLELTEEAFFAKSRFQKSVLPRLRSLGVKVSIDDFGVGYSSLAALADITADEIKIDRSFVTDIHKRPRSQTILKAIESLGHSLGMSIVAEGVETAEELVWLTTSTRIRSAQGYYFSRPLLLTQVARSSFKPDGRASRPEARRSSGFDRVPGGRAAGGLSAASR